MTKWLSAAAAAVFAASISVAQIHYPVTKKVDQSDNYHGTIVSDPYRWLENDTSDETKKWVSQQNAVTFEYLNAIPFRDSISKRLKALYNYERYGIPELHNGYYYYFKNNGLQNQPVLYRQKGLNGTVEVVIDPNQLSADATTVLDHFEVSKNGRYALYSLSRGGSDWKTIYIKDLRTLKDLGDSISWVKSPSVQWMGNGFYYCRYPTPPKGLELTSKNEDHQLWYHKAGTSQDNDRLIYRDSLNPQRYYFPFVSEDEKYLILYVNDRGKGFRGNSLLYKKNSSADSSFHPITKEIGNDNYVPIGVINNKFYITTNAGAKNYKLITFSPNGTASKWQTVIPESDALLQEASLAGGKLFLRYLVDVKSKIYACSADGTHKKEIALPGPGNVAGFNGKFGDKYAFYSFSTFNIPTRIYRYNISTGVSDLYRQPKTAFDPDDFETKQVFYSSKDGTRVPMFVVFKKGLKTNGDNPAILYGYGGFNVPMNPFFSTSIIPWLEQGGIFAVANIRGGSEYGERWHEAGMLEKKQNVFDDFIAAAEYLIKEKYTSPQKLAIRGGSNGGLLVGAVMNQRPDLFSVAIPEVGVMDMLRFQKFTIGWNWQAEYGSSDSASQFKYLYAYSPLHNIKGGKNYPATLIITGDHDDRVVPAHSFKYAATLQEVYRGKNPMLIRIDTNSGHGMSNMMKSIELTADIYAFTLYNMGLKWK